MTINYSLFSQFATYLEENFYTLKPGNESSVRGVRENLMFHFFFDDDEYCLYINDNGRKKYAVYFTESADSTFFCKHDDISFEHFSDIITYVEKKSHISRDISHDLRSLKTKCTQLGEHVYMILCSKVYNILLQTDMETLSSIDTSLIKQSNTKFANATFEYTLREGSIEVLCRNDVLYFIVL